MTADRAAATPTTQTGFSDEGDVEAAVLTVLLAVHPARLSLHELLLEMAAGRGDFAELDAYDLAVRDLTASGLLRLDGDSVVPTRAALRFAALPL